MIVGESELRDMWSNWRMKTKSSQNHGEDEADGGSACDKSATIVISVVDMFRVETTARTESSLKSPGLK